MIHLVLADQAIVPTAGEVRSWVDALGEQPRPGATPLRAIRTGALFPDAAARFADAGFDVIDTLALLRIDLTDRHEALETATHQRTVPLRGRQHHSASQIDRAAFGDPWGNDADDLDEIRRATPVHRARARTAPGPAGIRRSPLVAFAITGAAAGHGYLQRLAVTPAQQGHGHGRALAVDSLQWMRSRRLHHGLVNTAIDNARALQLYESLGFRALPEQLLVMELDTTS